MGLGDLGLCMREAVMPWCCPPLTDTSHVGHARYATVTVSAVQVAAIVHATAGPRDVFLATDGRHRGGGAAVDEMKRHLRAMGTRIVEMDEANLGAPASEGKGKAANTSAAKVEVELAKGGNPAMVSEIEQVRQT